MADDPKPATTPWEFGIRIAQLAGTTLPVILLCIVAVGGVYVVLWARNDQTQKAHQLLNDTYEKVAKVTSMQLDTLEKATARRTQLETEAQAAQAKADEARRQSEAAAAEVKKQRDELARLQQEGQAAKESADRAQVQKREQETRSAEALEGVRKDLDSLIGLVLEDVDKARAKAQALRGGGAERLKQYLEKRPPGEMGSLDGLLGLREAEVRKGVEEAAGYALKARATGAGRRTFILCRREEDGGYEDMVTLQLTGDVMTDVRVTSVVAGVGLRSPEDWDEVQDFVLMDGWAQPMESALFWTLAEALRQRGDPLVAERLDGKPFRQLPFLAAEAFAKAQPELHAKLLAAGGEAGERLRMHDKARQFKAADVVPASLAPPELRLALAAALDAAVSGDETAWRRATATAYPSSRLAALALNRSFRVLGALPARDTSAVQAAPPAPTRATVQARAAAPRGSGHVGVEIEFAVGGDGTWRLRDVLEESLTLKK